MLPYAGGQVAVGDGVAYQNTWATTMAVEGGREGVCVPGKRETGISKGEREKERE